MTTRFKMLVMDIDGTLVNKEGAISDSDRYAVRNARKSGLIVTLCTGRATSACLKILEELELDGAHIFFDGTLVYDPQKDIEIYSQPLPADVVREISAYAYKEGLPLDLFSRTRYFVGAESWRTEIRKDFFGIQAIVTDIRTIGEKEIIIKGGIAVKTPEEIALAKKFAARFSKRLNVTWTMTPAYPDIHFINIVNNGTSKGLALEALCAHLGIPTEQVCAIGDGPNDISLLSAAGLGIAMQNSPVELKAAADYITIDVDNSGVAEAIRRFLL